MVGCPVSSNDTAPESCERTCWAPSAGFVHMFVVAAMTRELGQELGLDKLGQRRRLLLFLDEMRSMQAAAAASPPDAGSSSSKGMA